LTFVSNVRIFVYNYLLNQIFVFMITNQIMIRDFNGGKIPQRTSDKFFNATALLEVYNQGSVSQKRFKDFWENKNTQEFLKELENELILNRDNVAHLKTHETSRGRGGATWLHPYLFVKFSMWLSPKFELQIIKWVYDNLIDFRNDAGDYYKEMGNEIKAYYIRNSEGQSDPLVYVKEAGMLNMLVFGTTQREQRNIATEDQLALMNELQLYNIYLLENNYTLQDRRKMLFNRKNEFLSRKSRKTLGK
jgi:hypothetical protein